MESLKEKFGVEVLDIKTRDKAGTLYGDKLFIDKEHSVIMPRRLSHIPHAILHFIGDTVFIADIPLLSTMKMEDAAKTLRKLGYTDIYAYYYKKGIEKMEPPQEENNANDQ